MRISVEHLSVPAGLDRWREDWDRLALEADRGYFRSWAWARAWMESFAPGEQVRLVVARRDDRVVGLLPLVRTTRVLHQRVAVPVPLTMVVGSGVGAADHVGCLTADPTVRDALYRELATVARGENLHLSHLDPADAASVGRLGRPWVRTDLTPTPWLDLSQASALSDLWPKKMTKEVRRRERRMAEDGVVRSWTRLTPEVSPRLDELRRLHTDRWRSKGRPGLFDEDRVRFFGRLAELSADAEGAAWLQILEAGGVAIGIQLGLRFGTRYAIIKSGWQPSAKALSPGQLLHAGGIEWALADGVVRYDFLRGSEPYKYRLGAVDELVSSFLRPARPSGWLLLGRELVAARVEARRADADEPDGSAAG